MVLGLCRYKKGGGRNLPGAILPLVKSKIRSQIYYIRLHYGCQVTIYSESIDCINSLHLAKKGRRYFSSPFNFKPVLGRYFFIKSSRATTVASTPLLTAGSGVILNIGEWCDGTGAPPAFARSKPA